MIALVSSETNPNQLYDKTSRESGNSFWGHIPRSYGEAVEKAIADFVPNKLEQSDEGRIKLQKLKNVITQYHKDMGIYSPKVGRHIELISQGSILMGQQPIIFGGPGLIGNKVGLLISLLDMFQKGNLQLAPIFFIGDYDSLQKELARQYFPNPTSHNAHIIDSEDYLPEESSIAAHSAKLPPLDWLYDQIEKLDDNFRGLKKQVKGQSKMIIEERWNHIKTILKTSFKKSTTLSDWGTLIWGIVTNIVNDFGIVYLPVSHPEIRKLISDQFYPFIEKRKLYTESFKKAMDEQLEMGYTPSLPHRHEDYSPFTLECGADNNRVATNLVFKEDKIFAEGSCPECDHYLSYDVSTVEKLALISHKIGPRVDTSQAIFQDIMNIRIRISGPGEIAYYASAAPAISAIGFDLPIFLKYKRAFYNSPWIEKLGKMLASRNQGSIHQEKLFSLIKDRVMGIRENDASLIQKIEEEMEVFIMDQYQKLLDGKQSIDTQKYLGWQYGRFTKHKFAQEVSWVWFDMAINTGITDYLQSYSRVYTKDSLIGSMYYINSII